MDVLNLYQVQNRSPKLKQPFPSQRWQRLRGLQLEQIPGTPGAKETHEQRTAIPFGTVLQ